MHLGGAMNGGLGFGISLLLALGCGTDGPSTADAGVEGSIDAGFDAAPAVDAGPPPTPQEAFLTEMRELLCAYYVSCSDAVKPRELCHPVVVVDDHHGWHWFERAMRARIARGTARLDADAAALCIERLTVGVERCVSEARNDIWAPEDWFYRPCREAFVGLVPEGGECAEGYGSDCQPGQWCYRERDAERALCRPRRESGPGEPCTDSIDCANDWDAPYVLHCGVDTCVAEGGVGDPCPSLTECAPSLWCDFDTRVCQVPMLPGLGEACGGSCEAPLRCVAGLCATGRGEGEPCDPRILPLHSECRRDDDILSCELVDETTGVCVSLRGDDAGDQCTESWHYRIWSWSIGSTCQGALYCRHEDVSGSLGWGHCVLGAPVGAACTDASPCERGARCVDGTCLRAALPGGACTVDAVCPPLHTCARGVCSPLAMAGAPCGDGVGCLQGRCVDGACCLGAEWSPCDFESDDYCAGTCFSDGCGAPWIDCADSCAPGSLCRYHATECAPAC